MRLLAVVLLSGVGALSRYGLAGVVQRRAADPRPWGTLTVNLVGALAIGVVTGLAGAGGIDQDVVVLAGSGFLGGFTTFSTWMLESMRIAEEGGVAGLRAAVWNVAGMLAVGMIGVAAGVWTGAVIGAAIN